MPPRCRELFGYAYAARRPVLVLGGGSNLLFAGDPPGAALSLTAQRIEIVEDAGRCAIVRADAGVVWHDFVLDAGHGLCGLENLSLILARSAPRRSRTSAPMAWKCATIHAVEAFDRRSGSYHALHRRRMRIRPPRFRCSSAIPSITS